MDPKKILIIRFSSIGDLALIAPAVAQLSNRFPHAEIHVLTKKAFAGVWAGDKRVKVRSFDADERHFGLPGAFRFLRELCAENYDLVVDLHSLPKSFGAALVAGGRTLRYRKASFSRRMYVRTKRAPADIVHTARRYVRALAPLGINTEAPLEPEIGVLEKARETVGTMVSAVGIRGRTLIGVAPGAQWETKQWGWDKYGALIDRLTAQGHWVALIGGKAEKEKCEELAEGKQVLNFAGLLNLSETLALMDFCRLVVSNDSGPMHMASARGADVIGVFGSTTRELGFWPLAEKSSIVSFEGLACRPCTTHGRSECPLGHFRCMRDLAVDQVWNEVQKFLGPPPPPSDDEGGSDEGLFILSE